ncbi:Phage capsid family protein [compost metagenome]
MALRQLMVGKKIERAKAALAPLLEQETALKQRSADAEKALEEAQTDEEIAAVEEEAAAIETEQTELEKKKGDLQAEITALESELSELNSKAPDNKPDPAPAPTEPDQRGQYQGGETRMRGNKYETREQMRARLERQEVREFYQKVAEMVQNKRAVTNTDIIIPEVVVDMILVRIGDYSKLYNEVQVESIGGPARVILDGNIPEAIWTEMVDAVQQLADIGFSKTEIDGFKVGGFVPVPNSILEDGNTYINLANYIENRIAMAIAKSLDKAILKGTGTTGKQPLGIVTALADDTTRNVTSDGSLTDIMSHMALIDDGEDGVPIGEVIAVMKRSTYYRRIAPQTFLPTADGRLVIQTATAPQLPDGTRIKFSQYAAADQIVLGDFKKYLLGERKGVQLASSSEVRFIEDQTVFKGTARYDGKPIHEDYFVVITISAAGGA